MRTNPDAGVATWLISLDPDFTAVTSLTVAEIRYGIPRLPDGLRQTAMVRAADAVFHSFAQQVLRFDREAAFVFVDVMLERERAGRPLRGFDAQIAAICRSREATLATRNTRDFEGLGLDLYDPWSEDLSTFFDPRLTIRPPGRPASSEGSYATPGGPMLTTPATSTTISTTTTSTTTTSSPDGATWVEAAPFRAHLLFLSQICEVSWPVLAALAGVSQRGARALVVGRGRQPLRRMHPGIASRVLALDEVSVRAASDRMVGAEHVRHGLLDLVTAGWTADGLADRIRMPRTAAALSSLLLDPAPRPAACTQLTAAVVAALIILCGTDDPPVKLTTGAAASAARLDRQVSTDRLARAA